MQVHRLFSGAHICVVLGCIGLAESFSYAALGVLNAVSVMSVDILSIYLTPGGHVGRLQPRHVHGALPHHGRLQPPLGASHLVCQLL